MTRRSLVAAALMVAVAATTAALRPGPPRAQAAPDLDSLMPDAFGEWRRVAISGAVLPEEIELQRGEAIAYRAYRDALGRLVTLVVAYGPPLGDSVRLHRPESCYAAQGFDIVGRSVKRIDLVGREASIVRLATISGARKEAVSYSLRIGSRFVASAAAGGFASLAGPPSRLDGVLVRISTPGEDRHLFDVHEAFLAEFAAALATEARVLFFGSEVGA